MDEIIRALTDQFAELTRLVDGLDEAGWSRRSGCEGWTLSDVVLHLAQTNDLAIASAEGRFGPLVEEFAAGMFGPAGDADGHEPLSIDGAADLRVTVERGASGAEVFARWAATATHLVLALEAIDPHTRVQWVAGQLSAQTLATTRLAETWIHTGDLADGLGVTLAPTNRLRHIARLAWRTLPYAFELGGAQLSGPVAFDLSGPDGDVWQFGLDDAPVTVISGDAHELCLVAARRVVPAQTELRGEGPDAQQVLALVRTYA